jgi:hypothetical protein
MRSGGVLLGIERAICYRLCHRQFDHGKEQGIKQLLRHQGERSPEPLSDCRCRKSLLDVKPTRDGSREKELPREEVHLDLPALLAAIVHHTVKANRRDFRRTRQIYIARWRRVSVIP